MPDLSNLTNLSAFFFEGLGKATRAHLISILGISPENTSVFIPAGSERGSISPSVIPVVCGAERFPIKNVGNDGAVEEDGRIKKGDATLFGIFICDELGDLLLRLQVSLLNFLLIFTQPACFIQALSQPFRPIAEQV